MLMSEQATESNNKHSKTEQTKNREINGPCTLLVIATVAKDIHLDAYNFICI